MNTTNPGWSGIGIGIGMGIGLRDGRLRTVHRGQDAA